MTKFSSLKIAIAFLAIFLSYSFSVFLMPSAPEVEDITVCEGDEILIVPTQADGPIEQELACQTFDFQENNLAFEASIEFNDGINDHFQATNGSDISITTGGMYSFEDGINIFWAAEDVDDNGGDGNSEQSLTFDPVDISAFGDVSFCFAMAAGNENPQNTNPGYDLGDHVFVEYSVDGGPFVQGLCFRSNLGDDNFNDPLHHDVNCDGNGDDGPMLTNVAQIFNFDLPMAASAGNSVVFRILVQMTSGNEEVAFDDIKVKGTPNGDITYNFYDDDPGVNPNATLLSGMATSYDPGTTLETSPDTIWVTAIDGTGESTAEPVIVTVVPNTDAGLNQFACDATAFELNATGDPTIAGAWSGGLGDFSDVTSPTSMYIPSDDEYDTPITLTWTLPGALCGESDEVILFNAEPLSAAFAYPFDSICPGDGIVAPIFNDGVAGFFEVTSANGDDLALDSATGEIDLAGSALGTYTISNTVGSCGNLMITGIVDGSLSGGLPKAIELFAVNDIPDLSLYGVGSASNGGGTDGEEFTFPADNLAKGDFIYVTTVPSAFEDFFGFEADYVDNMAPSINGDDAIELFCNGSVIDVFGEIDVDGTGQPWEYTDGWAHRVAGDSINLASFDVNQWSFSGINVFDNQTTNASSPVPFPIGTFTTDFMGICPNDVFEVEFVISDFGGTMLMCPADLIVSLDGGECGIVANIVDASAIDNCSPGLELEQVSGPVSGDFLDQSNSPYTVVFEGTTDQGVLVSCSYMIIIDPFVASSNTLACNGSINLSLNENCEALVTADMLLEGNDYGCYDEFNITATYDGESVGVSMDNSYGNGNSIILDNSIINEPIEISIIDAESGNSCWGYVIIEDKLTPVIVCPDLVVVDCGADISAVNPDVEDNCSTFTFVMDEEIIEGTCNDDFFQEIRRTWIAIDAAGNESEECVQVIQIARDLFNEIVFPQDFDGLGGNPVLDCAGAGIDYALDEDGNPSPAGSGTLIGTGEPMLGLGCSDLIIYYDDSVIPVCGNNSFKVLRSWTAVDWCSGEVAEDIQVIKILDTTAPEFVAPENVTISVDNHCRGEYQLPLIPISDDCGEASVSFAAEQGVIDNNYYRIDNPVLGNAYEVIVIGSDDCENAEEQIFTVTFVDLVPPVILAESSLTVTLAADGKAKLFASSFDDGSYDSCGEIDFSVIRNFSTCGAIDYDLPAGDDNFQFNDVVHFCCEDTGEPQMVTFRVCDDADGNGEFGTALDNCNTAMVEVIVQNKLAPILICPPAMSINCIDAISLDLQNTDLMNEMFGEPTVVNGCGGTLISQAIAPASNCGEGIIIRQFIALGGGTSAACAQIITVTPNEGNTLSCDRINFKSLNNSVYNWCSVNDNSNDPDDDLPAIEIDCNDGFSVPELDIDIYDLCTEVGEKITVDTFNFAGGACKKYLVHYEVIDQCVFDENFVDPVTGENDPYNSLNGYFEFYIEIDAFDSDGPVAEFEEVILTASNCENESVNFTLSASDNCTDASFITYQYKIDLFSDNTIDLPSSGNYINSNVVASGVNGVPNLPIGEHTLLAVMSDGCGNTSAASQLITILPNDKEPTPYCKTGFVASISAMGMVMINAEDFNAGSFDNCTATTDLRYSFSEDVNDKERTYTCDDLGFQFVTVYVTDGEGNQDFCNTTFLVQDNLNFCNGSLLGGLVQSSNGYINKDAAVMIDDVENMSYQLTTDENGQFVVLDNSFSEAAIIAIEDYNTTLHGVTAIDLLFIRKHILGIEVLPTNAQWIAADVDNNEKINGTDIIQLRKLLLGHIDEFSNNMSWIAYPADFELESLIDPYDYPRTINMSEVSSFDFTTIKVGDVNGSHAEGLVDGKELATRSTFEISYDQSEIDGETVYELYADVSDLVGIDWSIETASFNISSDLFDISEENSNLVGGVQRIIWTDIHKMDGVQNFATLVGDFNIDDLRSTLNDMTVLLGKSTATIEQSAQFVPRTADAVITEATIYPNPFSNIVNIELTGFDTRNVSLQIYSVEGKLVFEQNYSDQHLISLNEGDVVTEGVYTVKISDGVNTINKKLMKIK